MKARIERNHSINRVDIWIYETSENAGAAFLIHRGDPHGGFTVEPVPDGALWGDPTLSLRPEVFEAVLAAAVGFAPATDATTRHLNDAIGVRDRLLTLVEQS